MPEILDALAAGPMTVQALLAALVAQFDLVDPDPAALAIRLDELVVAGLVVAGRSRTRSSAVPPAGTVSWYQNEHLVPRCSGLTVAAPPIT